jgi:transcriptional regulator with XRE-family HTH domain
MLDGNYSLSEYTAMKLDQFISTNSVTEAEIAAKAGCSQSAVNKVRNGVGNPTFDLLRRISEATGGAFQPSDFSPCMSPRKRGAA